MDSGVRQLIRTFIHKKLILMFSALIWVQGYAAQDVAVIDF